MITVEECEKKHNAILKLAKDASDLEVVKSFTNEYQVKGYTIKKKHDTYNKIIKLALKLVSEISVITGAITVLLEIFV